MASLSYAFCGNVLFQYCNVIFLVGAGWLPLAILATDRMLRTALQHELRRARRYAQKTALVLFDLDDFAAANASFGELVGDRLLREAAILLSNKIRDIDLAGRPGEDEFALNGAFEKIGKRVLIIGVGNTAMDCCRTSLRLGAEDVKVMARKPRDFFKASDWELEDAEEENVEIVVNHSPREFVLEDGRLVGMRNIGKLIFAVLQDASGRIQLFVDRGVPMPPGAGDLRATLEAFGGGGQQDAFVDAMAADLAARFDIDIRQEAFWRRSLDRIGEQADLLRHQCEMRA